MFTPLEHPGIRLLGGLTFSLYTAPGYLACLSNVGGLLLLHFLFRERYAGIVEEVEVETEDTSCTGLSDETSSVRTAPPSSAPPPPPPPLSSLSTQHSKLPAYDMLAVSLCYVTRFADM